MSNKWINQRGSVLIISLVLLSTFLVIMIAWSRFAVRQSHEILDQGAEEKAFQVSEAGIEYVLFLFNNSVFPHNDISDFAQEIVGASDKVFEIIFSNVSGSSVTVLSRGYDVNKLDRCQEITAEIELYSGSLEGAQYYVKSWKHEITPVCATTVPIISDPEIPFEEF